MAEPKLNAGYPGTVLGLGRPPGGEWLPTPVFLPEEFHGQWSLVGYSPGGCKESDMIERLSLFFLPTCIWSFSFYMLISMVSFTNNGTPNNMLSQISLSGQLEHFIGSNFCHFSPSHLLFSLYWNFNSKSFDMSKLLPSLRKRVRRKFLLKDYRWIHVCPLCFQNYCKVITMCELERGKGMGDNGT